MKHRDNLFSGFVRKHFLLFTAFIFVFASLVVYSNTYSNGFHLDDFHTLVFNSHVHTIREIPSFFIYGKGFSGTPFVSGYRPVTQTVNALNFNLGHTNPRLYHLINLIVHLLCSFLVFRIALILTDSNSVSLFSGLIFLVHPMNTEVVNYISARSSSLSAFFYLASFLAFLLYRKNNDKKWILISLVIYLFSLLSKETSVTFPLILIAYDYFFSADLPFIRKLVSWCFYLMPVFLFLIVRDHFMHPMIVPSNPSLMTDFNFLGPAERVFFGSLYFSTHYLLLYLFPYPLSFDHPFPKANFGPTTLISLFFWILILCAIIVCRKRRVIPFLMSWFIITLLPIFLLPAISTLSLFQENRSYLSGTGICIILALGLMDVGSKAFERLTIEFRWIPYFIVVCLVTILSFISYNQNRVWKSEVTVWSNVLQKNPSSFIGTFSLGYGYLNEAQFEKAEYYFNKSLGLSPPKEYLYYIYNNLGAVYESRREIEKAFDEYRAAVNLSPLLPEAHLNLGSLYLKKGNYEKAADEMGTAMDVEYSHMERRVQAAIEIEKQGSQKVALPLFLKIARELPLSPEYQNLRDLIEKKMGKRESS
ncbi:MAG: tetratricopeptide repeat protein [Nitrospiria bacterium]